MNAQPSTSRYRTFDTSKFRNAPVSKIWASSALISSISFIPFRQYRSMFSLQMSSLTNLSKVAKMLFSRSVVFEFKDIIAGCLLIYFMRQIERRFGSRKYIDFIILMNLTSLMIEAIIHGLTNYFNVNILTSPFLSSGPYAVLFSIFLQFLCDVPFVPYAKVFGVPLSVKNLPALFVIQMFISTSEIAISCLSGLLAGLIYRLNILNVQNFTIIPDSICSFCSGLIGPISRFGEDKVGRLLPLGATVEAQRQDILDRFEQSLIYRQVQREHLRDPNGTGEHQLLTARRWFGRSNDQRQSAARVSQEKVQTLVEMGFSDRHRVEQVLRNTNDDLNSAALILMQEAAVSVN